MICLTKNHMINILPHHVKLLNHILEYLRNMLYVKNWFSYKTFQLCVVSQKNHSSLLIRCLHAHSCLTIEHRVLWSQCMCYCYRVQNESLYTFSIIMNNFLSCHRSEKQQTIRESSVLETAYFNCYAWETIMWKANKYFNYTCKQSINS
jgi:hypothetical protein